MTSELIKETEQDGLLAMNYNGLTAYLIEAIKELSDTVEAQQRQIDKWKNT